MVPLGVGMRHVCYSAITALACCCRLAWGGECISVGDDGSVNGRFCSGNPEGNTMVLKFGLPQIPAVKLWREGVVLRGLWVTNGIRYTQTILMSGSAASSNAVLLVNIEGENTNSQYTDARAEFCLTVDGNPQGLELKDGFVWWRTGDRCSLLSALEIPESGIKVTNGTRLQFSGHMPPAMKGAMTLKIPLFAIRGEEAAGRLREIEFDAELRRQLRLPEEPQARIEARVVFAHESPVVVPALPPPLREK